MQFNLIISFALVFLCLSLSAHAAEQEDAPLKLSGFGTLGIHTLANAGRITCWIARFLKAWG